jgi:Uma2 family endonuclease
MKLQEGSSYREPDILFVANENLERLTEDRLEGPADLVIEIVSDHTVHNDRDDKYKEYQAAGVREYWIIDPRPDKQRADFYHLDETGVYSLFATEDDERIESKVLPGFWLQPAWIWQANSLNPLLAFFEIRGLSAEQVEQIQQMLQTGNRD